jgi:hypothetical protein
VGLTCGQIASLCVKIRDVWMSLTHTGPFFPDRCWSVVRERLHVLSQPRLGQRDASSPHQRSTLTQRACRMSTVEHAHRIRPMQIHNALAPHNTIVSCTSLPGETSSPTPGFHGCQSATRLCVGQTGKRRVGNGLGVAHRMLTRRRTPLIVCPSCHHDIREGRKGNRMS